MLPSQLLIRHHHNKAILSNGRLVRTCGGVNIKIAWSPLEAMYWHTTNNTQEMVHPVRPGGANCLKNHAWYTPQFWFVFFQPCIFCRLMLVPITQFLSVNILLFLIYPCDCGVFFFCPQFFCYMCFSMIWVPYNIFYM